MNALKVIINGAKGRMGQTLLKCVAEDPELELVAALDLGDELAVALPGAEVVVDFTHASATAALARCCAEAQTALVIGTTGQDAATRQVVAEAAQKIPVVFAPNFSVGVNTLFWLTRRAAEILGADFDLEVLEMHHRQKHDAPSGTARRLVEILAEVRGWDAEADAQHGRVGMPGERPSRQIGVHALRGGDVVGDHTVVFAASGERVELSHKASSRETFARGALRAAQWVRHRPPGLYDMQDVLGIR